FARDDFEAAIQLDPENSDAYNGRAFCLARAGQYAEALADARHAVRLMPDDYRTLYGAARVFAQAAGRPPETEQLARVPRAVPTREQCRDTALDLLGLALRNAPDERRARFWQTIQGDAALNPIRRSPRFNALADQYARPTQ